MNESSSQNSEITVLDGSATTVPGQVVLPSMQEEMGYDSVVLEPYQEVFCWAYVVNGGNGQAAYLKAKPRVKETTARVESSKLLTLPAILQRIKEIQEESRRRWSVTVDDIIEYHGRVLKIDRRLFFDVNGDRIKTHKLPDDLAAIIDIADVPSRAVAADKLAGIMGMVKSKVELTGKDGAPMEHSVSMLEDVAKLEELRQRFAAIKSGTV